jgi:hypothetical protein
MTLLLWGRGALLGALALLATVCLWAAATDRE